MSQTPNGAQVRGVECDNTAAAWELDSVVAIRSEAAEISKRRDEANEDNEEALAAATHPITEDTGPRFAPSQRRPKGRRPVSVSVAKVLSV